MYQNGVNGLDCCDGCAQGLAGMGLTLPADTSGSTSLPWWQRAVQEIEKLIPRTPTVPVYTSPTFPSYPVNATLPAASTSSMFSTDTNWLPWVLGGAAVLILTSRRRR